MAVKQKSQYKVWWDKKEGVGRTMVIGESDEKIARGIKREALKMNGQQKKDKIDWLVDVSKNTGITPRARKAFSELSGDPRVGRIAFYGISLLMRVTLNFIMSAAGKKNTRQFAAEKEALEWLKGKQ